MLFTIWFYWNALYTLFPENEPEVVFLIHLEWWAFINPLQVLVMGATGTYLWRRSVARIQSGANRPAGAD